MKLLIDQETLWLVCGVVGLLAAATGTGLVLDRQIKNESARAAIKNLNARIRSWWVMCAFFVVALFVGRLGPVILFGLASFLAIREFIT